MNRALTPYAVSNAEAELAELLPEVLEGSPVFKDYLEVCTLWRQVAIGSFLLSNDPIPFFENLSKSVHAFLHGLEIVPAEEILTSGFLPFFDALACRNEEAIRRMTAAAPREPRLDREYEEDFLYPRIAMDLASGADETQIEAGLARFAPLAAGNPDVRLPVLLALRERSGPGFAAAVRGAAEAWREELQADLDADDADPDVAALASVSVEVLGWIEIAERLGIEVKRSYPLAPAAARAFHLLTPAPTEAWRSV